MSDDNSPKEYDPRTQPRVPRSRLDRPCDTCRKQKHLCVIPVRGEACVSCKSRSRPCTFDMPPTSRKRKHKLEADGNDLDDIKRQDGSAEESERSSSVTQGQGNPHAIQHGQGVLPPAGVSSSPGLMSSWARNNGLETTSTLGGMPNVSGSTGMSLSTSDYLPSTGTGTGFGALGPTMEIPVSSLISAPQVDYGSTTAVARDKRLSPNSHSVGAGSESMGWAPESGRVQNMPLISEERTSLSQTGVPNDVYTRPMNLLRGLDDQATATGESLDLEPGDEAESHFLGSGVFSGFTLSEVARASQSPSNTFGVNVATPTSAGPSLTGMGTLNFRQVSKDPQLPAFFVRFPALMYGGVRDNGKAIWDAAVKDCQTVSRDILPKALAKLQHVTLPSIPFINLPRLEAVCLGMTDYGPIPYFLLVSIVAHTTAFIPEIYHLRQSLWRHALAGMEQDMKRPRLRTIQLTVLLLISMPGENAGQSDIALARAIGASHLLGLHIDPSNWLLPQWERSLRKRIFWILLIHDKFRALLFGRPSNLHSDNYHIPLPTIADGDWLHERDEHGDMRPVIKENERWSFESWIVTCRLVDVVDKLLGGFYTIKVAIKPLSNLGRISLLEEVMKELEELENGLQGPLKYTGMHRDATLPTGVRSLQLTIFGLRIIIHRLQLESLPPDASDSSIITFLPPILAACELVVEMIDGLTATDRAMFWIPYSSHHISNTVTLLLRVVLRARTIDPALSARARASVVKLVDALLRIHSEDFTWDIATTAMKRSATTLLNAGRELDDMKEAYRRVANVLELPMPSGMFSLEEILGINDFNQAHWTDWANQAPELSWLDANLMSAWSVDEQNHNQNQNQHQNHGQGSTLMQQQVQNPPQVHIQGPGPGPAQSSAQPQLTGNANGNSMLTDGYGGGDSLTGTPSGFWRGET